MSDPTAIVIGLDGAHFELIDRWIEDGKLENIGSLIETGVASDMESCLPPVTSPNWKCYSSGQNPGKLGIFWWENIDVDEHKVYYPTERKSRPDEIWDYLSQAGYEICSIGTPLTYPPKSVNGVLVSGGPDARETGYTYPEELEDTLREEHDYRVHPETSIANDRERAAMEIHDLIANRFETSLSLMKDGDYDFVQITSFYINVLQHHFWDDWETMRGWEIIDEYVGRIRDKYPDSNLVLMSDHGANKLDTVFNINTWLSEQSYLSYKWQYRVTSTLADLGITRSNIVSVTDVLRLTSLIKRLVPGSAIDTVPTDTAELKQEAKTDFVDWNSSKAIASGQGPVYALDESAVDEMRTALESVTIDGEPIFENVYKRDEIYHGEFITEAPHLMVDQAPNVHVRGSLGREMVFDEISSSGWRAENKKIGLFVADGPDITGPANGEISILDLAPTLLSLFNIEPPSELDGNVLEGVIRPSSSNSKV
ncbi:alkaline phosphatase family protein [Haloarcula sp. CBA1122]|uniref:alkaline phosphatase family protein n=1 Tax=Haloarcula sp. CBA1122 TaxID=2668069 RepID=UPI0013079D38|nr:alkaline phosphatase family protein [Haloarcula sp. CBA1122]MUV50103.1 nucleotide pyrophosphatase [Haloarcula sp. CBA1122]